MFYYLVFNNFLPHNWVVTIFHKTKPFSDGAALLLVTFANPGICFSARNPCGEEMLSVWPSMAHDWSEAQSGMDICDCWWPVLLLPMSVLPLRSVAAPRVGQWGCGISWTLHSAWIHPLLIQALQGELHEELWPGMSCCRSFRLLVLVFGPRCEDGPLKPVLASECWEAWQHRCQNVSVALCCAICCEDQTACLKPLNCGCSGATVPVKYLLSVGMFRETFSWS